MDNHHTSCSTGLGQPGNICQDVLFLSVVSSTSLLEGATARNDIILKVLDDEGCPPGIDVK
jgi:hypothetical protein